MTRDEQLMRAFADHWANQHPAPDLRFACEQAFLAGANAAADLDPEPIKNRKEEHPTTYELGGESGEA